MSDHWAVLVNAVAGRRKAIVERTERALIDAHVGAEVTAPDGPEPMRAAVRRHVSEGTRHIGVVGGDGTLNLVVDELMGLDLDEPPVIGLLPAGSGSDFARTFALPQSIEGSVHHLAGRTDYPLDVGFLQGSWGSRAFVNVGEAGLTAACLGLADRLPRALGGARYQTAFWATLPRFPPTEIELVTDRRTHTGSALVAVFANAQFFGGGFNIAPKAAVMDGLLDLQIFDASRLKVLELFPQIKKGVHLKNPAVRRFTSRSFELRTAVPWPVEADGEMFGTTPVKGHVESGRLMLRL
ncbi:MAG: diacylglycerol kinase family protein [Acidimicrobiia bacterium]|nr:diacylglycerol kinase family protein [Acidimicrobiia bacterium]